jgi:hypothetical protein
MAMVGRAQAAVNSALCTPDDVMDVKKGGEDMGHIVRSVKTSAMIDGA